jgi:hypothetical protein
MTALQQSIHVALSLGLLEAVPGYDPVDDVVVTFQRGKILFGELTHFAPISLRTICLVSAIISGFAAAALDVVLVIVSTSKARINYPLNDYHSNDRKLHKIES